MAKIEARKLPAHENESLLILVLHLIGWWAVASFLDQAQSEVKQNVGNIGLFSTLN